MQKNKQTIIIFILKRKGREREGQGRKDRKKSRESYYIAFSRKEIFWDFAYAA